MSDRRRFIAGATLATLVAPGSVIAQPAGKLPRIGILSFGTAPSGTAPDPGAPDPIIGYSIGLAELGYVEGRNVVVERRYADGQPERMAAVAAELVQLKVDVILAGGPAPREAARRATRTIPIVTTSGADPVREGWAESLARPGGNVTGLTVTYNELNGKRLELLKQAFPDAVRVAALLNPAELPDSREFVQDVQAGARQLGLQIQVLEVRDPKDFAAAFRLARQGRAQVLYAIATNLVVAQRAQLAAFAMSERLMSVSEFPWMAHAGFMMSYGADLDDLGRRAIAQIDKILKGTRVGDIPIERPTKLRLTLNLKTAKAIGVTLPQALLLRADEVID